MPKKDSKKRKSPEESKEDDLKAKWDLNMYINKQRTLVFSSRGITHRHRHLISDLRDLLPHSKKDVKFDSKSNLMMLNEVADLKNCNNCIFLECRKKNDLYMWMSKTPHGPSARFLVQNLHTMSEVKLTGNCLKGSRPILFFDNSFDSQPHYQLLKELFTQVFGSPKGHPKVKPFVDHVLSFFVLDGRIWFRNYQIVHPEHDEPNKKKQELNKAVLVEIGPRFVLNPIRILSGSFGGQTLWENPEYVSPNLIRSRIKQIKSNKYSDAVTSKEERREYEKEHSVPVGELEDVFA